MEGQPVGRVRAVVRCTDRMEMRILVITAKRSGTSDSHCGKHLWRF